ncbi:MAG TPA: PH domain-containing protein [Rhodothermales bacterium]
MNSLHPSIRAVWTIRYALWSALVFAGALVRDVVAFIDSSSDLPPAGVLTVLALLGGIAVTVVAPRLRYRRWKYELRPEELYLEQGVFTRVRTVVPLRRVQHLDVSQGILEREYELARFIVHTAGTRASTVLLPGLHIDEANRLHDTVKAYVLEEAR